MRQTLKKLTIITLCLFASSLTLSAAPKKDVIIFTTAKDEWPSITLEIHDDPAQPFIIYGDYQAKISPELECLKIFVSENIYYITFQDSFGVNGLAKLSYDQENATLELIPEKGATGRSLVIYTKYKLKKIKNPQAPAS